MEKEYNWGTIKDEKDSLFSSETMIEESGNNIYFYGEIDRKSAFQFNKTLQETTTKMLEMSKTNGFGRPIINIHINSGGGLISAGIAMMDTIIRIKEDIDIYTFVEGISASAATYISCVGTKRFITGNSYMLIHQLSGGVRGSYQNIKDTHDNYEYLMEVIKNIYSKYTRVKEEELDEILKHDLYWSAEKCLKLGLVDEII